MANLFSRVQRFGDFIIQEATEFIDQSGSQIQDFFEPSTGGVRVRDVIREIPRTLQKFQTVTQEFLEFPETVEKAEQTEGFRIIRDTSGNPVSIIGSFGEVASVDPSTQEVGVFIDSLGLIGGLRKVGFNLTKKSLEKISQSISRGEIFNILKKKATDVSDNVIRELSEELTKVKSPVKIQNVIQNTVKTTTKPVPKELEPLAQKARSISREEFSVQFREGLNSQNLTVRETAQNTEKIIRESGFSSIEDFFNKVKRPTGRDQVPRISKERALVKVRGDNFELVGVPKKTGFSAEVRMRRGLEQIQKEFQENIAKRKAAGEKFLVGLKQGIEEGFVQKIELEREFLESIRSDIIKNLDVIKDARLREEESLLRDITTGILKASEKAKNQVRKQIGFQRFSKSLSNSVQSRLKEIHKINEWKNATIEQLNAVLKDMQTLRKGDTFLTDKQITGLDDYIKVGNFGKDPKIITKREMIEKFKESEDLLNKGLTRFISNNAFPSVDIKEGHPIITKIVNKADEVLRKANRVLEAGDKEFGKLMDAAEKSRKQGIFKRGTGEAVFRKMSGEAVDLTKEEQAVVDFLKTFFKQAREDLGLQKYRQNYITHTQQTWMEQFIDKGIFQTIRDATKPKDINIPLDIMLALDNIIGSEKFFKFALQRTGGLKPSMNIRKIFREYSSILETKKALDNLLPEAQAAQQLLLQNKSAIWMKRYLQNLKGRALDFGFRTGEMGWVARTGNTIVDFGYIRLLGLNVWSAVKNITGGEANSFVFQPFNKYMTGKARFLGSPKKAYKMISQSGILDGSYVDYAKQTVVQKGRKVTDIVLYGFMQAAEYEIRGSYFLGELTAKEWKAGVISSDRFREILDGIAITQGVYTKVDSPLFAQTVFGRAIVQFNRWRITNSLLVRRIALGMKDEVGKGVYNGPNTRRLIKMMMVTGTGMYLAYEAGKAGNERAQQVARASAELMLTIVDIATGEVIYDALANNPSIQTLGSFAFSAQQLASFITFGIVEEPRQIEFRSGIEDMYVAGLRLIGVQRGKQKKSATPSELPGLPALPAFPPLPSLPKLPAI